MHVLPQQAHALLIKLLLESMHSNGELLGTLCGKRQDTALVWIINKNQLYRKAKQSGDFSKYHKLACNRVVSNLCRAKRAYFRNLNPKNPKKVLESHEIS